VEEYQHLNEITLCMNLGRCMVVWLTLSWLASRQDIAVAVMVQRSHV